jgi:hypothetical protein
VVNITYFSVFFLAFYQEKERKRKKRQIAGSIACLRKEETGKGIFI